jgi:serine/threonine protein phosphatase PrpC
MSTPASKNTIQVASITDRGLSEKRPLNEDSLLADTERAIFAVADGVGGAEAGEVASQTAVEVLNEAFRHRLGDGEDVEDLMELAIQRANSSIHQMSKEHPRFSMMATTIVALHLEGKRATIGHVGDSRLYRITPDGQLHRETKDHSIVEEEVLAGRMTPEQAANHPSKNVISRALGAEESVEVDMKTIEVEEGTTFFLCSDGITRHISDKELRGLLVSSQDLQAVCVELKERCYDRGAEDNLTAVIVQIGTPSYDAAAVGEEPTVATARPAAPPTQPLTPPPATTPLTPPSRIAFPGPDISKAEVSLKTPEAGTSKKGGRPVLRFLVFLLFIAVAGGAFYGGMRYQTMLTASVQPVPVVESSSTAEAARAAARDALDRDPRKWLEDNKEVIAHAADSKDPEFLYLYGRALMLTGEHQKAIQAFEQALNNLRVESKGKLPLDVELRLASASAALKSKSKSPSPEALMAEQKAMSTLDELLNLKNEGGR